MMYLDSAAHEPTTYDINVACKMATSLPLVITGKVDRKFCWEMILINCSIISLLVKKAV